MKCLSFGVDSNGRKRVEVAEVCVYGKINFLDDNYSNAIGKTDQIDKLAGEYDSVIVSIGNS